MIYTITVNPAIDEIMAVDRLVVDGDASILSIVRQPGGKGINVSRGLRTLGVDSQALALIGDASLAFFSDTLARESITLQPFTYAGTTRISRTLVFQKDFFNTHLKERGRIDTPAVFEKLFSYLERELQQGDIVVLAGSVPEGLGQDVYERIIALCREKLALSFLDSSGLPLENGIAAAPFCVKLNLDEFADFTEQSSEDVAEFKETALHLIEAGISYVIITLGIEGAVLFDGSSYYLARVDQGQSDNAQHYTVGSGDAFMAGFVRALSEGRSTEACLAHAVACGTANTLMPGSALFTKSDAGRMEKLVHITQEKTGGGA